MYHKINSTTFDLEKLFTVAFENNAAPTAIFNLDTTIAMVNDAYCKLSGYTREEVVGMSWTAQLPPDELLKLKARNEQRLIDPNSVSNEYEFSFYNKYKKLLYAKTTISTLLDFGLIIMSFVDITGEVESRALLNKKNKELQTLIAIRDKDIVRFAVELGNYNRQIKDLQTMLVDLSLDMGKINSIELEKVERIITRIQDNENIFSWDKLNAQFNITYPEFVSNVLAKYQNLTPSEIKLCALLRLNLSTKDIAEILNQTYDSVRVSRTRLRGKLNLGANDNLVTFLMKF